MYTIIYTSPNGVVWRLDSAGYASGVTLISGGVIDLSAVITPNVSKALGQPGQRLLGGEIEPIVGSLTVQLTPTGTQTLSSVLAAWRAGWSQLVAGTLSIVSEKFGVLSSPCRLAAPLPAPTADPDDSYGLQLEMQVALDSGCWFTDWLTGSGRVTITNPGDTWIFPKISWTGSGEVILPSGVRFTLPQVSTMRVCSLSLAEQLRVVDSRGVEDDHLWQQMLAIGFAEGVPPGKTAVFQVPDNATLSWRVGFTDPWKG